MKNPKLMIQIRTRKLGTLLKDSRVSARVSAQQCADAAGSTLEQYEQYEAGIKAPSLPELETLSFFLKIPIEHFWGNQSISELGANKSLSNIKQLQKIRQKVIGATLRQARDRNGTSVEQLAEIVAIPAELISKYEAGILPVPLPELDVIASTLNLRIEDLFDQKGPVGTWRAQQELTQKISELPVELRDFVSKPVNIPYLQLAMRLSELEAEKLRTVAESLLEITY